MATRKKPQQPGTQKRNLATVMDVCEWLKISRSKLYALMDEGRLDYLLIGRSRRIRESEVDRFIAALEGA